ncbi:manganese-dependent inorganic pyrophosphatase [Candidatus Parcubacteria bacterium]|nr:MAG: manganese-dependent inorganic pyrophosphatase [Candidatus Parcubacteria bacterium]
MSNIYVIGHKSPDLDSVVAAISYANLKNKIENTDIYKPVIAGEANKETKYILEKYNVALPEKLDSLAGKKVILVDHNEFAQAQEGIEDAEIVEILDHHKLDFKYSNPIEVIIKPWGASCSIITSLYMQNLVEIEKSMATCMLAAMLVDTVITKSPTCTDIDIELIKHLSGVAEVSSFEDFGMEIFKVRSDISDLSDEEIIKSDFKDFNFKDGKFGIGQVETADLSVFEPREGALLEKMEEMIEQEAYHSVVLFLTDIIKGGSRFLVTSTDEARVEKALGSSLENKRLYIDGIMSRKKQVAPKFSEEFDK